MNKAPMNRTRRQLTALLILLLLLGLVVVPTALTWRQVRQERLNHVLIAAVYRRNPVLVRRLLHQGADPNAPVLPDDKRSVWQRLLDLLRSGSVSATATEETALSKAIEWAPTDHHKYSPIDKHATIQALVDAGADVNRQYQNVFSGRGRPQIYHTAPLVSAAEQGDWIIVDMLLDHHANINATDEYGDTALMYAAWSLDVDRVEAFLKRGADVNAKDDRGETALGWICHISEPDRHFKVVASFYFPFSASTRMGVACLLRHGATVNGQDSEGKTPLQRAKEEWHGDMRLYRLLKQAEAKE